VSPDERARRVRRGEGEVTQWPRGLVDYTPGGPPDTDPSSEEDRTANRIRLAARLIGVLRAEGRDVATELEELRRAESAFAAGRRGEATERIERLLGELGPTPATHKETPTSLERDPP